jgi:hypothetical protein
MRPYDMATDTMFEFMGVRVDPAGQVPGGELRTVGEAVPAEGRVAGEGAGHAFDGRLNDSFRVLNRLLDQGIAVRRVDAAVRDLRPGDFLVSGAPADLLAALARETGVNFSGLRQEVKGEAHDVKRLRLGLYQRYWGGNIDEGWTRLVLEQFGFPYASLMDAEIKKGALNQKYDAIILPDDSTRRITGEKGDQPDRSAEAYPPEYRSGIGDEGVAALKTFVEKGGTLVTLGGAGNFAIEKLELSVRNVVANTNSRQFWCPGSTLKVNFHYSSPLGYGMPPEGLALYLAGNPVFEILPGQHNDRYQVIVRYADRDLLESGWLVGEKILAGKAAVIAARYGQGQVILLGTRAQHRAQTHGAFKLFFNALIR